MIFARSARFAGVGLLLWLTGPALADEHVRFLHTFVDAVGGTAPGPVVGHQASADPATWALYGATRYGGGISGPDGQECGLVYKLSPPSPGGAQWVETRLHVFGNSPDGCYPTGPLVFGPNGRIYGTTINGGTDAYGTVFELTPPPPGQYFWNETVLHSFNIRGGANPNSLVMDAAGALYGVAFGKVFKLTPPASGRGGWYFEILHTFQRGEGRVQALAPAPSGDVYGVTLDDLGDNPNARFGSVFKLSQPATAGVPWALSTLYGFASTTGPKYPIALFRDQGGILYGVAGSGGAGGRGVVFRLQPPAAGRTAWTETNLYEFSGLDGGGPNHIERLDASGALYGATTYRTSHVFNQFLGGIVFRLDPPAQGSGKWTRTVLATTSDANENAVSGALARDPSGGLYTSAERGAERYSSVVHNGTVFKIVP